MYIRGHNKIISHRNKISISIVIFNSNNEIFNYLTIVNILILPTKYLGLKNTCILHSYE